MKKLILIILSMVLIFCAKNIEQREIVQEDLKIETTEFNQYHENIYIDDTVNEEKIDRIYDYLNLVPEWIIKEYDGKIFLTEGDLNDILDYYEYEMSACYDVNSHNIFLNINDMSSILHEIGHFFYRELLSEKEEL
jgi:hypothetical protein